MPKKLLEIAAEIVQTQVGSTSMTAADIAYSLRTVFQTLREMQRSESEGATLVPLPVSEEEQAEGTTPKPADPKTSIQDDKVICLECGAEMRQLTKRHLSSHGISPREYKQKYGFSMRTPLAAKSLTKARSRAAKKRGLPEKLKSFIEARRQEKGTASATTPAEAETAIKPRSTRVRKKKA